MLLVTAVAPAIAWRHHGLKVKRQPAVLSRARRLGGDAAPTRALVSILLKLPSAVGESTSRLDRRVAQVERPEARSGGGGREEVRPPPCCWCWW